MPLTLLMIMALAPGDAAPAGGGATAACAEIRSNKARLACYDRTADAHSAPAAERAAPIGMGAATVARRKEARVERKEPARVETVSKAAQPLANGRWRITLADGAVWRTIEPVTAVEPGAGQRVVITRSVVGSYFLNIDNTIGVRGLREK